MMVNALMQLTDLPAEIITFSDDMDGLRKVPENVPNQNLLQENLHKPLTEVPDPFEKFNSFGEHNNEMLKDFLNGSGIDVKGLPKFSFKILSFGIFSGTFLKPSISSEKVIISVGKSVSCFKALTIIEVLATSPNVPI